jgi:DNA-binding NarL/FixJ family response regulator
MTATQTAPLPPALRHDDAVRVRGLVKRYGGRAVVGGIDLDVRRGEVFAVRAAARGETVLTPPVAARLVSRMRAPAADEPTARELQVFGGVARGLTNAEIGRELFIGEATVKTHRLRVFAELGVDDRTRAVMVAVERGLLPGPGAR